MKNLFAPGSPVNEIERFIVFGLISALLVVIWWGVTKWVDNMRSESSRQVDLTKQATEMAAQQYEATAHALSELTLSLTRITDTLTGPMGTGTGGLLHRMGAIEEDQRALRKLVGVFGDGHRDLRNHLAIIVEGASFRDDFLEAVSHCEKFPLPTYHRPPVYLRRKED